MENKYFNFIRDEIATNDVVLFMKGSADFPKCGFSATIVSIMRKLEVPFKDIDILADEALRQAIKDFTDWPTVPQLYVQGEFIGGCDIVREMYDNGELAIILANFMRKI
jgi:monothiol glutaredoxin